METLFVTESRELLFTGTEDIDVRPLHSPVLHYEGDSREEAADDERLSEIRDM